MTKITTFITQGYTPPYVKIFEVKSQQVLCVSPNSLEGWGTPGGAGDDLGNGGGIFEL